MSDFQKALGNVFLKQKSDLLVAAGIIAVVMMMIIPLPTVLLDTLLALNLLLSLIIILIVLFSKRSLDFSVFPTLLLAATVYGLALNVSSTRLILTMGMNFDGKVIRAFASFVVGGAEGAAGLVIGFIIFIILIAVQFIVITKGATRVAEVAARFTLDSLPGKQMAIEAEYNSGALTEEEATRKKNDLQREVDFYGAMDGASKFVSGNVKVGLLITLINVVGGLIVGTIIRGESFNAALNNYVSLTIGDGLVSQFPALLISTATALIVTRAISEGTLGEDISKQFSGEALIYWIAAVVMIFIGLLPGAGFPAYVFVPLGLAVGYAAYRLSRRKTRFEAVERKAREEKVTAAPAEISPVVPLDPLSLELGYGLIPLVDKDKGAELLDRLARIRRESALDLGLVVPRIRIIDNMRLDPSEYCFKIKGVEVGRGIIRVGHYLSINPGGEKEKIPGEATHDPAFNLPAQWITEEYREQAERAGYTVVDSPSIIATHLTEIIKKHAEEILGRQEVKAIMDTLRADYAAVVDEVMKTLSLGEIQKVLQGLLKEQVSIRNMVTILETLGDFAPMSKDVTFLVEKVRQGLGRQICLQYADDKKILRVLTLNPEIEQKIIDSKVETAGGVIAALDPDFHRLWIQTVLDAVGTVQKQGHYPLVLCSEAARPLVKSSSSREIPELIVLSVPEIVTEMRIEPLGEIRINGRE